MDIDMFKFYYYEKKQYEKDNQDEQEYIFKALFVEKNGIIRLGTILVPRSFSQYEWKWKPNFNGRYSPPFSKSRDQIGDSTIRSVQQKPRCEEDNWYIKANQFTLHRLKDIRISFDEKDFERS